MFDSLSYLSTQPPHNVKTLYLHGQTIDGERFRPSDWAERLCGIMSRFRPSDNHVHLGLSYSPYVKPLIIDKIACVYVDREIEEVEPLAWQFLLHFARDNRLKVTW